jgi:hypothetical protein
LGLKQAEGISARPTPLVDEHLFALELIERLELEQHRASTLMLAVSRPGAGRSIGKLQEFDQSLPGLTPEERRILPSPALERPGDGRPDLLEDHPRGDRPSGGSEALLPLVQQRYDQFVRLTDDALKLDTLRAAAGGRSIERASSELASESGGLLAGALILSLACAIVTIRFTLQSLRRIAGRERNSTVSRGI